MISQKQNNFNWPEEETSPSPHQAQAPTPVKLHRWVVVLLSILGVALPMVAGSMLGWPWGVPNSMDSQEVLTTIVLAAVVSVGIGAFLLCFALHTWWVAVFTALAWVVGEFLSLLVRTLVEGGGPEMQSTLEAFWLDHQIGLILLVGLPLFVCAVVGGLAAKVVLDKLAQRRASRY